MSYDIVTVNYSIELYKNKPILFAHAAPVTESYHENGEKKSNIIEYNKGRKKRFVPGYIIVFFRFYPSSPTTTQTYFYIQDIGYKNNVGYTKDTVYILTGLVWNNRTNNWTPHEIRLKNETPLTLLSENHTIFFKIPPVLKQRLLKYIKGTNLHIDPRVIHRTRKSVMATNSIDNLEKRPNPVIIARPEIELDKPLEPEPGPGPGQRMPFGEFTRKVSELYKRISQYTNPNDKQDIIVLIDKLERELDNITQNGEKYRDLDIGVKFREIKDEYEYFFALSTFIDTIKEDGCITILQLDNNEQIKMQVKTIKDVVVNGKKQITSIDTNGTYYLININTNLNDITMDILSDDSKVVKSNVHITFVIDKGINCSETSDETPYDAEVDAEVDAKYVEFDKTLTVLEETVNQYKTGDEKSSFEQEIVNIDKLLESNPQIKELLGDRLIELQQNHLKYSKLSDLIGLPKDGGCRITIQPESGENFKIEIATIDKYDKNTDLTSIGYNIGGSAKTYVITINHLNLNNIVMKIGTNKEDAKNHPDIPITILDVDCSNPNIEATAGFDPSTIRRLLEKNIANLPTLSPADQEFKKDMQQILALNAIPRTIETVDHIDELLAKLQRDNDNTEIKISDDLKEKFSKFKIKIEEYQQNFKQLQDLLYEFDKNGCITISSQETKEPKETNLKILSISDDAANNMKLITTENVDNTLDPQSPTHEIYVNKGDIMDISMNILANNDSIKIPIKIIVDKGTDCNTQPLERDPSQELLRDSNEDPSLRQPDKSVHVESGSAGAEESLDTATPDILGNAWSYIQGNPLHGSEESKNSENSIPPEWSGQKIRLNKLPKGSWFGTRSKKTNTTQPNTAEPNPSQSKSVTKKRGWISSLFGLSDTSVDTPIVTPPSEFELGGLHGPKEKSKQFLDNFEAAIVEIEKVFNKNEKGEQKSPPSKINPIDVKNSMTAALQIYLNNKHNIVEKDQVVFKSLRNRYNKLVGIFLSKAKEKGIGRTDPPIPILITDDLIIDKIDNRIREIELAITNFEHTNVLEIEKKIGELSVILAHTTLKDHFGDIIDELTKDLQTRKVITPTVNDTVCNDDEEISIQYVDIYQDIQKLKNINDDMVPSNVEQIQRKLLEFREKLETKNCLKTYQNRYATLERELSNYTGLRNPIPLVQNIGGKRTVRKNKTRRLMTNRQHMRHCK
jgi:hypothetical protein